MDEHDVLSVSEVDELAEHLEHSNPTYRARVIKAARDHRELYAEMREVFSAIEAAFGVMTATPARTIRERGVKMSARLTDIETNVVDVAHEAFGPFPVQTAAEAMSAIQRGIFEQRQRIELLFREVAEHYPIAITARAMTNDEATVEDLRAIIDIIMNGSQAVREVHLPERLRRHAPHPEAQMTLLELLRQIDAVVYSDPADGKIKLKLIGDSNG